MTSRLPHHFAPGQATPEGGALGQQLGRRRPECHQGSSGLLPRRGIHGGWSGRQSGECALLSAAGWPAYQSPVAIQLDRDAVWLTPDRPDPQVHHPRLDRLHLVRRRQRRHECGHHDLVSRARPLCKCNMRLETRWWMAAEAKGLRLTRRAMILWISQSGSDEYEYQLTV